MTDGLVRVEWRADVAGLILDRGDRGNALSPDLVAALLQAFEGVIAGSARLIVFSGNGRNFCTGFDFTDLESLTDGDLLLRFVRVEALLQTIFASPVPTMAVAQGRVFGAGADLFAACDHRIAITGASFCFPGPGFGIVLGNRRLAERVGQDAARALLMSGRTLPAQEAVGLGLAQATIDACDLDPVVRDAAACAARLDPLTVSAIRAATSSSRQDADMASLVRSGAREGLKDRIRAYRAGASAGKPSGQSRRQPGTSE